MQQTNNQIPNAEGHNISKTIESCIEASNQMIKDAELVRDFLRSVKAGNSIGFDFPHTLKMIRQNSKILESVLVKTGIAQDSMP